MYNKRIIFLNNKVVLVVRYFGRIFVKMDFEDLKGIYSIKWYKIYQIIWVINVSIGGDV